MKQIYICSDTITGIYSALYDAWKENRDKEAGIELRGKTQQQLSVSIPLWKKTEKRRFSWSVW